MSDQDIHIHIVVKPDGTTTGSVLIDGKETQALDGFDLAFVFSRLADAEQSKQLAFDLLLETLAPMTNAEGL